MQPNYLCPINVKILEMNGVKVQMQADGIDILKQLAAGLGKQLENDRLAMPEFVGEGFCKAYTLGKGISAIIAQCCYKIDFALEASDSESPVFILQYDHIVKCKDQQSEPETSRVPFTEETSFAFAISNHTHQQPRYKGKLVKSLRIIIRQEWLEEIIGNENLKDILVGILDTLPGNHLRSPLNAEERLWLREVFIHNNETAWDDFYSVIRIKLLLEKFIFRLKKQLSQKGIRTFSDHETEQLKKAEKELVKNFAEPAPTISFLSKNAGMSPSKFKTDFRQMFGLPVYRYFQKSRMIYARSLMVNKKLSIKEVGAMSGYSNMSHFSAAFKKEFGILPKEYLENFNEQKQGLSVISYNN
ncbi:MAG: helix-turn-helix domain-containing protein [Terrimonas sp.]|nr:helix-turn-helix domain-containing protein [Terrimonas sp.]